MKNSLASLLSVLLLTSSLAAQDYSVSGSITLDGEGLEGVSVTMGTKSDFTNKPGAYVFTQVAPGNYTITPTLAGHTFTPPSLNVVVVDADIKFQDFIATAIVTTVSGTVTSGGNPVNGINVTDGTRTAKSDATGAYTIEDVPYGTFTIEPIAADALSSPKQRVVSVSGNAITGQDFSMTFKLAGTITVGGAPLYKVNVSIGSQSILTDPDGYYEFAVDAGTYTVVPTLAGYAFTPPSLDVLVTNVGKVNQDFAAESTAPSISGTIVSGTTPLAGVNVSNGVRSVTTDAAGKYTFSDLQPDTYTITPTLTGAVFTPATLTATVTSGPLTGQDFTAAFLVTGSVTNGENPLAGVSVGNGTVSATTDGFGAYTLNLSTGPHTLRAVLAGYAFDPPSIDMVVTNLAVHNLDFATTANLSGRITSGGTPIPGVIVSDGTRSSSTDSSGNYLISGVPNGKFTLTPTFDNATFSPPTLTGTMTGMSQAGLNFTALFSVGGTILSGGNPLPGVSVSAGALFATTDANGDYTITGFVPGSYTLTPALAGYTFAPPSSPVTIATAGVAGKDFTANPQINAIKGTIIAGATPLAGVTVSSGATVATTDASGNYTLNLPTGTHPVTPGLAGYTFSPASKTVTLQGSDSTGNDFNALMSISGTVLAGGTPLQGVLISGPNFSAVTDASGHYVISGVAAGFYTITPSKSGHSFTPPNRQVSVTSTPVVADFTASTAAYSISGRVMQGNNGLADVLISDGTHQATTNSQGNYSLGNLAPGSYTLTAAKAGFAFVPPTIPATIVNADLTNRNFTAETNIPPAITSGLNATPNPGNIGEAVQFTCAATDSQPLTWNWNFGDGGAATTTAGSTTHTYSTSGTFTVSVVVVDSASLSSSATVTLVIIDPNQDADNDGMPDFTEQTAGTNPNDPNSKPGGTADFDGDGIKDDLDIDDDGDLIPDQTEYTQGTHPYNPASGTFAAMTSAAVAGAVKPQAGKDSFSITAVIANTPAINQIAGQVVQASLGGANVSFTLDAKGKAKITAGTITLTTKPKIAKDGSFVGGSVTVKVTIKNGSYAAAWLDEGVDISKTASKQPITVTAWVQLNGIVYNRAVSCLLTSKAGKSAGFKGK